MSRPAILYDKPECPFCWRLRMALEHLGVAFECRAHDLPKHRSIWTGLTPFDTVPVLQIDDLVLVDSQVAIAHLDETVGGLWPNFPAQRIGARTLACYADQRVGVAVRELVFEKRGRSESDWDRARIDRAFENWRAALPYLEQALEGSDRFDRHPGMVDFVLASRVGLAAAYGMHLDDSVPCLRRWFAHVRAQGYFTKHAPPIVSDWLAGIESGHERNGPTG